MPHDNRAIIAEADPRPVERRLASTVGLAALVIGLAAAWYYAQAGLTLSHYDARAHLVVARRIVDSLTPGWVQIGAVWLPLPHLVNMPIVQWDWAYRTGYPSTLLSVALMAVGLAALAATLWRLTRAWPAAVAAPLLILLNPNVLYLQSTPMTEPMLFGLALVALWCVTRWVQGEGRGSAMPAAAALAALTLTRYEGWFVAGALVLIAGAALWRQGAWRVWPLALGIGAAVGGFLLLSKGSTGVWFVTSGFYEPDPALRHQLGDVSRRVWDGTGALGGSAVRLAGLLGALVCVVAVGRARAVQALPLAMLAAAALPLYAFFEGHPFRIRYMVPIVVACGALAAMALSRLPRRLQAVSAALLVVAAVWQRPPLDAKAAMVLEAQWETPYRLARQEVTAFLTREWDGTPILASMGSLGHYMQEASHAGFGIADFVHEGNGEIWASARERPAAYVNWVLIEERAEGGDELAARARRNAAYLERLVRVAEGGGVALYRRVDAAPEGDEIRSARGSRY